MKSIKAAHTIIFVLDLDCSNISSQESITKITFLYLDVSFSRLTIRLNSFNNLIRELLFWEERYFFIFK